MPLVDYQKRLGVIDSGIQPWNNIVDMPTARKRNAATEDDGQNGGMFMGDNSSGDG